MYSQNADIQSLLFMLQDTKYRDFHCRLIPNIDKSTVIGVRIPALRKLACELNGSSEAKAFTNTLPHKYYDENNLHGFLIEKEKDYDTCISEIKKLLPYIDNWATCDLIRPKVFRKHTPELLNEIKEWVNSDQTYTIRFGIGMLMCFYLDGEFRPQYPKLVSEIQSEEYYVNMMIAWYFATALAKQYDSVIHIIEEKRLEKWTHNKAISKAIESYRITAEQKDYLRSLKIK